jgi:hypothetical protein
MDEIEETQEADDTHHETASIELGDETDDRHISSCEYHLRRIALHRSSLHHRWKAQACDHCC